MDIYLTKREIEVVRLLAEEKTTEEIAQTLFVSTHTIETHRKNILSKIHAKNVVGVLKYALRTGIVNYDLIASDSSY